ncbi:MAG: M1 family metallopeptidase [Deltaproteobacteria bacterium]|nr:M1 family metallopeptidase [Deltaproteobacteria bacterium]
MKLGIRPQHKLAPWPWKRLRTAPSRGSKTWLAPPLLGSLACLAATLSPATAAEVRLGKLVSPTSQAIRLTLNPAEERYRGTVEIEIEAKEGVKTFRLHSEGHEIHRLSLRGKTGRIPVSYRPVDEGQLEITAKTPLSAGPYALEIDFDSAFNTEALSLFRMEMEGNSYAFTQFEADEARAAFPCWDEPEFKIPYQMTLTVPSALMAVSNTPVQSESEQEGWRTTRFRPTPPLPSYLLALAVGPLETVPIPGLGIPGRVITIAGQSHLATLAVQATGPILEALESYFDGPYPFAKLDLIAAPEFLPGAMENPGAVIFADRILLLDPATASISQQRTQARVIAHELAHMWFGNLVTMQWWDDLWLNEAFADWMGDKITHQVFPEFDQDLATAQNSQGIMARDALSTAQAIRRPLESTAQMMQSVGVTYNKGKTVLGMFENWMGEQTFRKGVLAYLSAHARSNATAEDLWKALDKAAGSPISPAMTTFLEQAGIPIVSVETLAGGRVRLSQKRFANFGSQLPPQLWQIPVSVKFATEKGVETRTLMLRSASQVETLTESGQIDWIFPNAEGRGYYHWQLPDDELGRLSERAGEWLNARERIALAGNISTLLDAGEITGAAFMASLGRLAGDSEAQVIRSALRGLQKVKVAFVPEDLEDRFAVFVRSSLTPGLERIGWSQQAGEKATVATARANLMTWLGSEGRDPKVKDFARRQALAYLENPTSVEPALVIPALRLAAHQGDEALFKKYREGFEAAKNPTERSNFLIALGSFHHPALRSQALEYALSGPLRPNEVSIVFQGAPNTKAGRDSFFHWFTENYDRIAERLPEIFMGFLPYVASGCSQERLDKAKVFFAAPEHQAPGTERTLLLVSETVTDCLRLRQREEASARAFLANYGSGDESEESARESAGEPGAS